MRAILAALAVAGSLGPAGLAQAEDRYMFVDAPGDKSYLSAVDIDKIEMVEGVSTKIWVLTVYRKPSKINNIDAVYSLSRWNFDCKGGTGAILEFNAYTSDNKAHSVPTSDAAEPIEANSMPALFEGVACNRIPIDEKSVNSSLLAAVGFARSYFLLTP